jgi:hypothetical protein
MYTYILICYTVIGIAFSQPVHSYVLRHIYAPCKRAGYSVNTAQFVVFFCSAGVCVCVCACVCMCVLCVIHNFMRLYSHYIAVLHEYVVSVPMHSVKLWAFVGMLLQVRVCACVCVCCVFLSNACVCIVCVCGSGASGEFRVSRPEAVWQNLCDRQCAVLGHFLRVRAAADHHALLPRRSQAQPELPVGGGGWHRETILYILDIHLCKTRKREGASSRDIQGQTLPDAAC